MLEIKNYVGDLVAVLPTGVVVGGLPLRDLRKQKNVVIPDGAQKIGERWFENSEAESVTIPASVKEIAPDAFRNCDGLKVIYVEDGCEASLYDVRIPNSVRIGPPPELMMGDVNVWDFRDCRQLVIPEGVERIGNHWFFGSDVESVTIPVSVREIGTDAFCNCKNLKLVTFASGSQLEKIGTRSFSNTGIERITIPKNVDKIPKSAFEECKNLKEVVFEKGNKLRMVGMCAFSHCVSLAKISLPEGLKEIGIRAFASGGLEEIVFPKSLKEISREAFKDCESLKKAQLNKCLEMLGEGAFCRTAIESILLPSTLKRLEADVFCRCYNLRVVGISGGVEYIGKRCF